MAILSRGYGNEGGPNDEALVLEENLPDVPHLQGVDRVELAHTAVTELESEVLVLDDGFQHRRLARDLDLVLIDASSPWGHGSLLPRGLLREPLSRPETRRRASADSLRSGRGESTYQVYSRTATARAAACPSLRQRIGPLDLSNSDGEELPLAALQRSAGRGVLRSWQPRGVSPNFDRSRSDVVRFSRLS